MDKQVIVTLFISFLSSAATVLGATILFSKKGINKNKKILACSLGFAGGVMISVSLLDLYPNMLSLLNETYSNKQSIIFSILALIIGIFFGSSIDNIIPQYSNKDIDLYRVGIVSMVVVALHNFPEGIATFMTGYADIKLGISIALAIAMHNIPEGITIAVPIYYSTGSKKVAIKYAIISGMCEFFGALIAFIFLKSYISDNLLAIIFGIVSGIMLYISLQELIPTSRSYGADKEAILSTFIGICIMPLTHIL